MTKFSLEQHLKEWKQRNCINISDLGWFCSQIVELAFCCKRNTENLQAGIKLEQQLDRNSVLGSISIIIIIFIKNFQEFGFRLFFLSAFLGKFCHFWLLHDWLGPYSVFTSRPKICRLMENSLPVTDWWRRLKQRQSADLPACFLPLGLMMKSILLMGKAKTSS